VLLRHELADAVEVFVPTGPIRADEADSLRTALRRALALNPRGVVVDLSQAGPLSPEALGVLNDLRREAPGWPRPALVVCGLPADVAALIDGPVRGGRADAVSHVDDRSAAPRRRFVFQHSVDSARAARAAVVSAVDELRLDALTDDLQLVVSELVTNAIRHAQPPLEMEIEASEDTVTVAVLDGSPGRPMRRSADADAEGGRGLLLVDLLTAETGVRPHPPGKTIWACMPRAVRSAEPT
jgi:anti-sigma regulatory factor (Ser/Thr protein kinase)